MDGHDAADFYVAPKSIAAWTTGLANLHRGFDDVCGDTFGQSAKTGDVAPVTKTWSCPVAVHGTIGAMVTVLTSTTDPQTSALQRPLPGGTSTYDSIAGCVTR